jgi:Nucleotidyltransferase domain
MSARLVPPKLLDPVVAYFKPRRVILFGSAARGEAGPDSDIDLLVIVDDETSPDKLTFRAGYESRRSYRNGAADVFPVAKPLSKASAALPEPCSMRQRATA